jgi:hypothetical protein
MMGFAHINSILRDNSDAAYDNSDAAYYGKTVGANDKFGQAQIGTAW